MWQSLKNIYHLFVAVLANVWFGWPSKKLTVIGVTGTDGKTTTASLIYHILQQSGYQTSLISSLGAKIGDKEYNVGFHVTTPSPFALQRFLKKAADSVVRGPATSFPPASARSSLASSNDLRAVGNPSSRVTPHFLVLEVTSHALDQHRVWGIDFAVGVLTNVTHEHLDYHKTYENYVKTKAKLLQMAKKAVINRDDESYKIISKLKAQNSKLQLKTKKLISYGIKNKADVSPKTFLFKTDLVGEFNKYNCLAAIAVCRALGISDQSIRKGLQTFKLPIGRAEIVYQNNFSVMIDFAHTPNALEQILSSIRPTIKGRLIHVFGSAGKRDFTKRPQMGKVSSKYADVVVLTAEDPRGESVEKIMDEIVSGIHNSESRIQNGKLFKISNRQKAITAAITMARKGDLVITTGKSHEKSMNYGHGEEPWDEFEAVKKGLRVKGEE